MAPAEPVTVNGQLEVREPSVVSTTQGCPSRVPWITLAMLGVAIGVLAIPGLSALLIYERSAILNGEIWRLFTGNWVHFSTRHLVMDALALGIAGWMVESRSDSRPGWYYLLSAGAVGGTIFLSDPAMEYYAGLSGIATGAMVYLGLFGLRERGPFRRVCVAALLLVFGKIILEMSGGEISGFGSLDGDTVVAWRSHLAGAVAGVAAGCGAPVFGTGRRD